MQIYTYCEPSWRPPSSLSAITVCIIKQVQLSESAYIFVGGVPVAYLGYICCFEQSKRRGAVELLNTSWRGGFASSLEKLVAVFSLFLFSSFVMVKRKWAKKKRDYGCDWV